MAPFPLLPRGENPFFTRELRQWSRRQLPTLFLLLGCTGAMALVLFIVIGIRTDPQAGHTPLPAAVAGMVGLHLILCVIAGATGGDRIFADEHRRSTLEATRLVPYSAPRWLALKLAFPVYLLALAWSAALPLYLMARYLEIGSLTGLLQLSLLPLLAGVGAIGAVLLFPPDYQERQQQREAGKIRRAKEGVDRRFRGLLAWLALWLAWFLTFPALFGQRPGFLAWDHSVPFFSLWAPLLLLQESVLVCLGAASFVTAVAAVRDDKTSERWALLLRMAAFAVTCAVGVGLFWARIPVRIRWGVLACLGALALWESRPERGPKEDRLAGREIAWIESKWDNPVFLWDLRAYIRRTPIRRSLINEAAAMLLLGGVLALVTGWRGTGAFRISAGNCVWVAWWYLQIMCEPGSRMARVWKREQDQQFLTHLSLTPLLPHQISHGRLRAALLYVWSSRAATLMAILALVFWSWGVRWCVSLALFGVLVGLTWASLCAQPPRHPLTP